MRLRWPPLVLVVVLASCAASAGESGSSKSTLVICPDGPTVDGIDVSHWQATIDWDAVAADGIEFAFIRVSHGTGTMDREFARNWPEAQRVGIIRGVYQFFSAGDDPVAQADLLIDQIGGALAPGDLPPVLDVEGMSVDGQPRATIILNMRTWIARVEERLSVTPIIYSAKYFWQDQLGNPDFTEHPLWVAHYGVACPDAPTPWTEWVSWQYTSTGSVAGIAGNVDRNYWNGTLADLMAFVGTMPTCGDGWCSGGETNATCAEDCPVCRSVPPLGRDVDESEPLCFERGGPSMYLRDVMEGWLATLTWTHATDAATVANYGVWRLTFDEAGLYRIEAHTPAPWGESMFARYDVRHGGMDTSFTLDQSAVDGWQTLGDVRFEAGGEQWVRLDDNTGEPVSTETMIVYDALRLTRLDPPVPDDGGAMGDGSVGVDAGVPTDGGTGTPEPGCGCRVRGRRESPGPSFGLLLAALLLLRPGRRFLGR